MSEYLHREHPSTSPFVGLKPTRPSPLGITGRHLAAREPARAGRTLMATMPVLLVGSLAISSLGMAPPPAQAKADQRHRSGAVDPESATATIDSSRATTTPTTPGELDPAAVAPATYTVRAGDTVSSIAGHYGLSTAVVLALNGLGWKSLIFPGQVLRLSRATAQPAPATVAGTTTIEPVASVAAPRTGAYVTTPAPVTAAPVAPAPSPAPSSANGSYVIQKGDTITAIAKKFGVSVSALLAANNMSASSIIYAGRTLTIPGLQIALVGSVTVPLSPTMRANAQTIISVGRSLRVPDYGIVVALAASAQESGLLNLSYGDRDSVGLFQQRPSAGWGTVAQLTTTSYAARLFYGGPSNPNRGKTRGLLDIPGWQSMTVTQAAQAVQLSGAPNAYAKWEASARFWLAELS